MSPPSRHKGPLLVVEDREDVRCALARYCKLFFEQVHAAASPSEAEDLLERHHPVLLVCDYWLGDQHPPATDLIPGWRRRFPCIERVALMTGTNSSALGDVSSVDAVLQKPLDMDRIIPILSGEGVA